MRQLNLWLSLRIWKCIISGKKNSKYDFEKAVILFNEAIDLNNKAKNIKDLQEAADYFLKSCYNVGINYEKR